LGLQTKSMFSVTLSTGETLHLRRDASHTWRIDRYVWQIPEGNLAVIFPEVLGWNRLGFESTEDAVSFVEAEIGTGRAPGMAGHLAQ